MVKLIDEVEGRLELARRCRENWTLAETSTILKYREGPLEKNKLNNILNLSLGFLTDLLK